MNNILEQYGEIIRKNLPSMAAEEMKKFIEQATANEGKLTDASAEIEKLKEARRRDEAEINRLKSKEKRDEDLNNREAIVFKGEQALELEKLKFEVIKQLSELKATEAEKRANSVYNLTSILFQNERVTQSIMETRGKFIDGHSVGGNYVNAHHESDNYNYQKQEIRSKDLPSQQ